MRLARPRMRERVTLWHARNLSADRRSHPPRPHGCLAVGKSGLRHPEDQEHSVAAGAQRRGRSVGRRGAKPGGRCAQRTSSTCSSRLSERRERSERSEFRDATAGRAPQGSRTRSADRSSVSQCRCAPAATRARALQRDYKPTTAAGRTLSRKHTVSVCQHPSHDARNRSASSI